jgi:hypothetical protein
MSTAVVRPSDALIEAPEQLGSWVRILAAILLPIGPAAIGILRFVLPYNTVDEPAAMAAKVAGNLGAQSMVIWLGLVGTLTIVPAVIWIGRLTFRAAPRLTTVALALAVPGYLALGVIMASDVLLWTGLRNGLDPGTVAGLLTNSHPATGVAEALFVLGHLLGTVLLGAALWRTRTVPLWAAIVTTFSQPLHLIAAIFLFSRPLDLVAWMMTAVGFAAAGGAGLSANRPQRSR